MAVVFISPKNKQKKFFMGITISLVVFLAVISFWVFLSKPSAAPQKLVFNKPKVSVDLKILDSDQFKKITSFERIPLQFNYVATTAKGQNVKGLISAYSREEATKILEEKGLKVGQLKQVDVGRLNPFIPY